MKPRSDSKLKTLSEDRQADIAAYAKDHSLSDTVKWLRSDGLKTSSGALSMFLSWYSLQRQLEVNESTVAQVLEDLKSSNPKMSQAELEQAGQLFFSALAIQQQDSLTWKRIQDSKLKAGLLILNQQKFQRDTVKLFIEWAKNEEAVKLATSNSPQPVKMETLGKKMFGELW